MGQVEEAVLQHYAAVQLDPAFRDQVRDLLHEALAEDGQATRLLHDQLKAHLAKLDLQEDNLIDLAADGQLPQAKIRRRLHRINEQRRQVTEQLADADTQLNVGAAVVEAAVDLLDNLQEAYRQTTDHGRRLLNQAIFKKLYVGDDNITADELHPPFDALVTAHRATGHLSTPPPQSRQRSAGTGRDGAAGELAAREPHQGTEARPPSDHLFGQGGSVKLTV